MIQADIPSHCGHIFQLDEISEASKTANLEKRAVSYYFDAVLQDNCEYIYECQFDVVDKGEGMGRNRFDEFEADCSPPVKPLG